MYALILAGGKGERLRPITDEIPKPMIRVNGRPILEHQIEMLKQAEVTDIILCVGYKSEVISEYFENGEDYEVNISYSYEESPLGRGGAIKQAMNEIEPEKDEGRFFVLNGDIITSQALNTLDTIFLSKKQLDLNHMATIMVTPLISPYGIVDISGTDVVGFREKIELPYWINAGLYMFDSYIYDYLPDIGDHETQTFPVLSSEGRLSNVKSRAFWKSVDSFKDLSEVEQHFKAVNWEIEKGNSNNVVSHVS